MKKVLRPVIALVVAMVAVVGGAGVAAADVVVAPGTSGHVCSGYAYLTTNPNRYFQTCVWADSDEVWVTVNFGNASSSVWAVDETTAGYWRSGVYHQCFSVSTIRVPANSTLGTTKASCRVTPRPRAAFQAYAYVSDGGVADSRTSDTLQVQ